MPFMGADPAIYDKMMIDGKVGEWADNDVITILQAIETAGFKWDPLLMNLKNPGDPFLQYNTPWIHSRTAPCKHCALDHHILFGRFRIIHPRCQNCWKVTATLRSFDQLIKMEALQNSPDMKLRPSKCGIEMRDYVPKFYGAYMYHNSVDEGMEGYEIWKKAINDYVGKVGDGPDEIPVILKRGCTEYEMIKGPSPFWHLNKNEQKMLEQIEAYVSVPNIQADQPLMVKTHVRLSWVLWAHMNGDMSYVPYNGGNKLFPDYVKYHGLDLNDVKRDLAVAKFQAMTGKDPAIADKFLTLADQFKDENGLSTLGQLSHAFGVQEDPLKLFKKMKDSVPETNTGEHDELT